MGVERTNNPPQGVPNPPVNNPPAGGEPPPAGQPQAPEGNIVTGERVLRDHKVDVGTKVGTGNVPEAADATAGRVQRAVRDKFDGINRGADIIRAQVEQRITGDQRPAPRSQGENPLPPFERGRADRQPGELPPKAQGDGNAFGRNREADDRARTPDFRGKQPDAKTRPAGDGDGGDRRDDKVRTRQNRNEADDGGDGRVDRRRDLRRGDDDGEVRRKDNDGDNRGDRYDAGENRGRRRGDRYENYDDRQNRRDARQEFQGWTNTQTFNNTTAPTTQTNTRGEANVTRNAPGNINASAPPPQQQAANILQPGAPDRQGRQNYSARNQHFNNFDSDALPAAAIAYLRGGSDGRELPNGVRRTLDTVIAALGDARVRNLVEGRNRQAGKAVEHVLLQLIAHARGGERTASRSAIEQNHLTQRVVNQLAIIQHVQRFFERASVTTNGGQTVRQAEDTAMRFLINALAGTGRDLKTTNEAALLLRDLRAGAFRPVTDGYAPFPLTGRARVVSEMMELMRTLDAIDRFTRQFEAHLKAHLQNARAGNAMLAEEAVAPTLPGQAGREEVVRLIKSLGGVLTDATGSHIYASRHRPDLPLQLGDPVWLSVAGGLLGSASVNEGLWAHSPLLHYGFDAVYPVIGFDGRTLVPQEFVVVQANINDSEPQWLFGQEPLTEGWLRALIERLKDSSRPDFNAFGMTLEEALTEGRLYTLVIGGAVKDGSAEANSFGVRPPPERAMNPVLATA